MAFNDLVVKAQTYFPDLQIKYKDQDPFMKVVGTLLFFNPSFKTSFVTTIGHTMYWPSQEYVQTNAQGTSEVFIHECTHMYDENRLGSLPFKLGYLFPQLLALPMLLLFFVLTWKIVLPLVILCLLPWPAPWRAYFERRAYFVSMRVGYSVFNWDPNAMAPSFARYFKDSSYYWMMPFGEDAKFAAEAANLLAGKPESASEPALDKMIIDLMSVAK
jgi:hypothetical protein